MIRIACEFQTALDVVSGEAGDPTCKQYHLSPAEWSKLRDNVDLLEPFYEATTGLFAKERPTLSKVIIVVD